MGKPYSLNVSDGSVFTTWSKNTWTQNPVLSKVFDGFIENFDEDSYSRQSGGAESNLKAAIEKKTIASVLTQSFTSN